MIANTPPEDRLPVCRCPSRCSCRLPSRRPSPCLPYRLLGRPLRPSGTDALVMAPDADGQIRRAPQERSTRQKRALAAVLEASVGFRSAQELHADLQAQGENIALTTIYNQVRALADAGELDALRSDDGENRYRRCATGDHHHHLVCRHCGTAIEVVGPEVERWATRIGKQHGFIDVA